MKNSQKFKKYLRLGVLKFQFRVRLEVIISVLCRKPQRYSTTMTVGFFDHGAKLTFDGTYILDCASSTIQQPRCEAIWYFFDLK